MELQFIDFEGGILSKMEVSLNEFTPKANLMALSRAMFDRVFLGTTLNDDQAILVLEPDGSITLLLPSKTKSFHQKIDGKYRQIYQIRVDSQVVWESPGSEPTTS